MGIVQRRRVLMVLRIAGESVPAHFIGIDVMTGHRADKETLCEIQRPARSAALPTSFESLAGTAGIRQALTSWSDGPTSVPSRSRGICVPRAASSRPGLIHPRTSPGSRGSTFLEWGVRIVTATCLLDTMRSTWIAFLTQTQNERRARRTIRWVVGGSPPFALCPAGEVAGLGSRTAAAVRRFNRW
jgi:hypothetical protein